MTEKQKHAFTLAEVLITLGIIGVVAALTMPVLIRHYHEQATITKLKKFNSIMQQALLLSVAENGEIDNWDWIGNNNNDFVETKAWYDKYLSKYLNKVTIDMTPDNAGMALKLSDGTICTMNFHGNYLHFKYYTNIKTYENKTSIPGKDNFIFGFKLNPTSSKICSKKFRAYGCWVNIEAAENACFNADKNTGSHFCLTVLERNNWKVPSEYPFKL